MCYSKCNKGNDIEAGDIFQCNYCKEKAQPEPSGNITATIFGTQAKKNFSINAQEWMESTETITLLLQVGQLSVEALAALYIVDEQIIQLCAYQFHTATTKFNVNAVHRECVPTIDHSTFETRLPPPLKKACKKLFEKEPTSTLGP
ncbi:hypothetical protein CsSME_00036079 [Camellia sinensis var. sinensis]